MVILVIAVVIAINYYLKHHQEPETLNTTYAPHEELLNGDGNPSEKTATAIEDFIDDYVNKCNSKDYSGAFNLLTDECKTYVFDDSDKLVFCEKNMHFIRSIKVNAKNNSTAIYCTRIFSIKISLCSIRFANCARYFIPSRIKILFIHHMHLVMSLLIVMIPTQMIHLMNRQ